MKLVFLTIQRFFGGLFELIGKFFDLMRMDGVQIGGIICFVMYFLIAAFAQDCRDGQVTRREAAVWQAEKDQIWFNKEAKCGETCGTTYSYRDGTCFCVGAVITIPESTEPEQLDYSLND
jgi:hypothetical protein